MDELFKEISDSRRIRSHGNTTYLKDGRLFASEKILRGYEDLEKLKTMGSTVIEGLKNTPDFLFGVAKGIPGGIAKGGEETFKTFLPFVNNNVMPWLRENVPGYNSMNEYLNDALAPEGTAQEIGSSLGEVGGQVVAPGGVYAKAFSTALKPMGYGKNFLANVLGYGTAEFAGMPPEEEGLMEMGIQLFVQNEQLKNTMLQSIAADEDASFFLQKIQKAPQRFIEGGILGETAEQAFRSLGVLYNAVKGSPNLKATLENIESNVEPKIKIPPHKRVGTTGQYIGGPPGLDSPQKLSGLRKKVNQIAIEAKNYRFWYERSGKQILEAVNGDVDEADKLIQAIAVTSPGTRVKGNLDFAVQAYYQHKAGLPIKTGRFPTAMSKKLQEIFDGKDWDGRKTDDFYNNLMVHIDPSRAGPVTVDLWMVRAFGYKTDMPSQKQYEFVTKETQRLAQELGWEPQQVQASIWVAMKAKAEKTTLEEAGFDFADALQNNKAQISWESIPGRTGNHMPEMFDAPYEVQANYHVDISKAFLDDDGRDLIAKRLGVISPGDFEAPGYFEGKVSPGTQTEIIAPKQYKGPTYGEIEQGALNLINAYSAVRGILLKQDAVGWHRPFYNPKKMDTNGLELSIGRDFTEEEIDSFAKILAELSGHGDYNPIASRQGIRIINFDPEFDNKEFTKLVESAIDKLELSEDIPVKVERFNSQNGYIGNDWSVDKNGEAFTNSISTEGQSDILGKVRSIIDEIQPKVDEVEIYYAEKYGFTRNAELNTNVTKSDDGPSGGPTGQATGSNQGIIAYSGSGADFKEFSFEKVGTGQGETNFGYGLYFDADEDIATFFRGEDGKTYKVNLNVKDTDLIDVETSFSQQPENVQNALRKYYDEYGISEDQPVSDLIAAMPNNPASANYGKTKEFAEDMNSQGLKGLRYKTLSHPTKTTPSDTFVVFDDKVIEILEKYGIVGPVLLSAGLAKEGLDDGNTS